MTALHMPNPATLDRLDAVSKQLDAYIAASPHPDRTQAAVDREILRYSLHGHSDIGTMCRVLRDRGVTPVGDQP